MRYPGAIWEPGPPANRGYDGVLTHPKDGAVLHSADGNFVTGNKPRDIMIARGVSWHFTIYKNGRIGQSYEVETICWHAGQRAANFSKVGIEHEGTGPLTPEQLAASVQLTRWLSASLGFPMDRSALHEHNEFFPTACPSGRIPWDAYTGLSLEARIAALEEWREQLAPLIDADWAWREEHKQQGIQEHTHEPGSVER